MPYQVGGCGKASSTDPGIWGLFDVVVDAYAAYPDDYDAVGFALLELSSKARAIRYKADVAMTYKSCEMAAVVSAAGQVIAGNLLHRLEHGFRADPGHLVVHDEPLAQRLVGPLWSSSPY